jgi:hypothetical protein
MGESSEDPLAFNYVLMGKTSIGVNEEKTFNLYFENSTPIVVKAESVKGTPLLLYEWRMQVMAHNEPITYYSKDKMIYTLMTSQYGDRTVYISNKPEGENVTVDVVFMYHGVPTLSPTPFGLSYSKGFSLNYPLVAKLYELGKGRVS